jgi:anti-sigma factor RsiW
MKCKQAQPNLLDYSRGLLAPKEAEAVRTHLEGCSQCAAALEAEVLLAARLEATSLHGPLPDVWPLVQLGIHPSRRSAGILDVFRPTYIRRLAAVAATVGVIIVVLFSAISWRASSAEAEKQRVREAAAMLMTQAAAEQGSPTAVTTDATLESRDDPLAATREALLEALEREL